MSIKNLRKMNSRQPLQISTDVETKGVDVFKVPYG